MTRHPWALMALLLLLLPFVTVAYTQVMMRVGSGVPPKMADASQQADLVRVYKEERRLELWRDDQLLRSYAISLGRAPEGHKHFEGDQRTPEGWYTLDWRNARSIAHLSLHISYPNDADRAHAKAHGRDPGGLIMIHGIINGWGFLGGLHRLYDWTDGCIAVTNAEMREIWSLVPNGTPIHIQG
ncbi:L,D-transpeptidase family protein [Roseinatronobacter monicus]|uniref:L,D-transpeptidase-like protein n=1 Tax=Roseinatronobacter monicus TaxID=393481 RepID=A0A543K3T5_9RHOB|nr:L,D-transpeptidase family protein [Roseinatronobacter monicus]TQM89694.1 L,D-transpeptidase-like protein [Roseinatronobacter monicus]